MNESLTEGSCINELARFRRESISHTLKILALACAFLCSAVAPGQVGTGVPATARLINKTLNVVYLGDSITQGVQLLDPITQSPPVGCTAFLRQHLSDISVYMENMGRNGHTTVDFLPETKTDFPQVEEAAGRLQAAHDGTLLFSVMLGTNDSASYGTNGSPVSPAQYEANLSRISSQLLHDFPNSMVIVHRPTWYSANTQNGADYREPGLRRLQSYTPVIAETVTSLAVSFPGRVFLGDTRAFDFFAQNYADTLTPELGKQGTFYLHPNVAGAKALGELWGEAILKRLSSDTGPNMPVDKKGYL